MTAGLLEFARAHFALSKPYKKTGKTRLKVLLEIKEQTGIVAQELRDLPSLPYATNYIWGWYQALTDRRTSGFNINPISWPEMKSYFDLMRITPKRWEVATIAAIDDAFLQSRLDETTTATAASAKTLGGHMTGEAGASKNNKPA